MKWIKWERENQPIIRLWTIVGFGMFLYQSILLFFTVFLKSYPGGYVIINTNSCGELIFEIILSGIVIVIAFICLVISIISTILHCKKEKKEGRKLKKNLI